MHTSVQSVHATTRTREMCAVRRIVSSPPAQNFDKENAAGCNDDFKMQAFFSGVLVLSLLQKWRHFFRIGDLSNESWTMTALIITP